MSTTTKRCRKCHECKDNSHHWIPNPRMGSRDNHEWICKHCPAKGDDCEQCDGYGYCDDDYSNCQKCNGDGVIEVNE